MIDAINKTLRFRGENTNTTGGMRLARERLFDTKYGMRPDVKHVMLLVTDGVPTFDANKLPAEVQRIKDLNIRIVAVGVTNQVSLKFRLVPISLHSVGMPEYICSCIFGRPTKPSYPCDA